MCTSQCIFHGKCRHWGKDKLEPCIRSRFVDGVSTGCGYVSSLGTTDIDNKCWRCAALDYPGDTSLQKLLNFKILVPGTLGRSDTRSDRRGSFQSQRSRDSSSTRSDAGSDQTGSFWSNASTGSSATEVEPVEPVKSVESKKDVAFIYREI